MTLAGSWSVVNNAHIQAITLFMVLELSRSRSVVSNAHIQAFTFFTALTLSRSRSIARRTHFQAFARKLTHVLNSLVRTAKQQGAVGTSTRAGVCAFTGDPQPRLFEFTSIWHSVHCAEITLCQHFLRPPPKEKTVCQDTKTRLRARTHETTDTRDNRERDAEIGCKWQFFGGVNAVQRRTPPSGVRCTAPNWTSEVRRRSWRHVNQLRFRRVWHGRVVFVVSRLCHGPFHGVFGSGLRLDVPGEELIVGVECRGLCDGLAELGVAACAQAMPSSCPRLVLVAEVRDCASCPFGRRLAPPCFVHCQAFEGAIEDGAGKSGARLRLDAAREASEDGHVAVLQVRCATWRDEAQHDVRESGIHGGHVSAEDPRLSLLSRVHHVVQTGRELQDRGRRCPAVL